MRRQKLTVIIVLLVLSGGCAGSSNIVLRASPDNQTSRDMVTATEIAFAQTMADRDFEAFKTFLSEEAIFMSGDQPLRGKTRVAQVWQGYFESAEAPFSWDPERVVVLESGGLAMSFGPVKGADGSLVGTFTSIWQHEADGRWRIIFDKGGCACDK
ncbi:MAG: nuclear transport factor 2 family protein [Gammaproteobacteria bacterium]|nr:nuclear transport factor 2 family protein [Gammaproteobacteria bacterium]MDH3766930.1 nuclear transport factor 2 family protein [Gammaproteobacteria bacterium]